MVPYLGDFAEDDTVLIVFNTFTSDDPSASCTITNFINTDVHIHKEDDLAQRNNAAGITVSVDFDGITGSHMIKIDTNDDTVAGFWVTGKDYFVRIEGTTVDAATINVMVGHFSIENRYNPVTDYDPPTKAEMDTAHALLATEAKQDIIDTNVDQIETAVITNAAGVDIAADIIALKAETALIVADTDELQTDDYPTSIAAIKAETALIVADTNELQTDNIPGTLTTIAGYLDTEIAAIVAAVITNAAGADIAADIIALKAETALIVADTNELQTDDIPAAIAALNDLSSANVEAAVDAAFENAIPGAPTANSINDFLQTLKYCLVNKMVITEATGNTVIYEDDDATPHCTVAVAFDSDGTDTTRKRLE